MGNISNNLDRSSAVKSTVNAPSDNKAALISIRATKDAHSYIQIFNHEKNTVSNIYLKKASIFSFLESKVRNTFANRKLVKISVHDPVLSKISQYYVRVDKISKASGLAPENVINLAKQKGLEEKLISHNFEALAYKVELIFDEKFKDEFVQYQLSRIKQVGNLEQLFRNLNSFSRTNHTNETFKHFINETLKNSTLDTIAIKYDLTKAQQEKLESLSNKIGHDKLDGILQNAKNPEEIKSRLNTFDKANDILNVGIPQLNVTPEDLQNLLNRLHFSSDALKLLNTYIKASEEVKNGLPSENVYVKKSSDSYSFAISSTGEFIISFEGFASGSFKKVNSAIDVKNSTDELVKIVIRGDKEVELLKEEQEIHSNLWNLDIPYILPPPTKVTVLTKTSPTLETNTKSADKYSSKPEVKEKYVYFDSKLNNIYPSGDKQLRSIAQFAHDYSKGLSFFHDNGYIHGDVKPANALQKGNRTFITDFGLTVGDGQPLKGGTVLYFPERLFHSDGAATAWPQVDNYALGITFLVLLYPDFLERFKDHINTEYLDEEKKIIDERKEYIKHDRFPRLFEEVNKDLSINPSKLSDEELAIKKKIVELAKNLTIGEGQANQEIAKGITKKTAEELSKTFPWIDSSDPTR